ncbi:GyrI-like small molecule binding protein [Paenibacillus cellulosilyticus]|uniref:GyrI-like small molecule binding protein n=1 Tax=Paenibacillus cellulosilyticus TaxID=375489 RepID=A0A2V2Z1G5_9BACL|nr:GyrI-like domain-containing protein [Paenibacillus cellulosilyticus]PWW08672.1 GyrI-like small molecule binding protein [Paenibacillus cellulosilyticus]QKS48238.1 HTH domain-containing protein [Paenibacillus cellulosilyticus]
MTKTQRLHELIARIYERQQFTVDELAEEFHVSYRTMLRYLQELSGMGVPLYAEPGRGGGYSLLNQAASRRVQQQPGLFSRCIKPMTHIVGVEFKAPFTAVYMARVHMPAVWETLMKREHEIINVVDRTSYVGVALSRSHIYHYVAGIEVTHPRAVPEGMISITLPPREYAVYNHAGAVGRSEVDDTYFYLLDKLRKQGLDHDPNAYTLEVFDGAKLKELTVYIPLKS